MRPILLFLTVSVVLGVSALGGCVGGRTAASRFYLLHPVPSETLVDTVAAASGPAVGVGPVVLPHYLDRPEIVTRASRNEVHIAEFHRWAEPLEDAFARALAENLSLLLSTHRVTVFPWVEPALVEYQLEVEVFRFEGNGDGTVSLIARWSITRPETREVLLTRQSSFSEVAGGTDYRSTISAMDRTVAQFSRQVAAAIEALSHDPPRQ
jgi:uncharacterized lipoprotein YmbA